MFSAGFSSGGMLCVTRGNDGNITKELKISTSNYQISRAMIRAIKRTLGNKIPAKRALDKTDKRVKIIYFGFHNLVEI